MNNNKNTKRKANTTRIQIRSKPIDPNIKAKVILAKIDDILDGNSFREKMNIDNIITPIGNGNNTFDIQYTKPKDNQGTIKARPAGQMKKLNKIQNKKYKKGKSFMTDVGLVKQRKENGGDLNKEDDGYIKCVNEKIDEIINNIQDIDDHSDIVRLNDNFHLSKIEKEGRDIRQLLNDIDECKNQMQEDFDEVKYLIKFADNTHKLIGRHKNVMTNIFKEAGLRPRGGQFEDEINDKANNKNSKVLIPKPRPKNKRDYDDYDDDYGYNNNSRNSFYDSDKDQNLGEVFNKLKKINKIKDNLCNIQDDFLGYHQRLKDNIKPNH